MAWRSRGSRVHRCPRRVGHAPGGRGRHRSRRPQQRGRAPHSRSAVVTGSVLDGELVGRTIREHGVTGIVHIAAKKQVEESVRRPLFYCRQNVEGLRVLLEAATESGVASFVFSSSATVYGQPDVDVVGEETDLRPVNPYGTTKLVGERMIEEVAAATGLRYANLRHFNVAGAAEPALADRGVSNLVPMVFQRLQEGHAPRIFGDDYPTPDGTCVRDFCTSPTSPRRTWRPQER